MPTYKNLVFPHKVGGPLDEMTKLVLVVTEGATVNPVKAAADLEAYNAEDAADQARHELFSEVVEFFSRYGAPVWLESDGDQTITMYFERAGLFDNATLGKPDDFSYGHRANAYDIGVELVANTSVTAITTTVDDVLQNAG